jgi:hypothetical protein
MNPDNPSNRKLLNMTLLVILSPLYALVLFTPEVGILRNLAAFWSQGTPFAAPLLYVFILACIVSVAWLLWRGALVGPISVLLASMIAYGLLAGYSASDGKTYELLIGAGRPMLGIDVFCNDVHLGKTPIRISEAGFNKLVKPWDRPPEQPMLDIYQDANDDDRYTWAKFFYVPHDIFDMHKQWPPDHRRYRHHSAKETLEDLRNSKYWWHFEKDGCIGLTQLANFGGGSGGGRLISIEISPSISFLSAEAHLDALLAQLKLDAYQASQAWISHFLRYKDLLFLDFYAKAQQDKKLQPALDALVRAEFKLSVTPSEPEAQRVVDEIVQRVQTNGCFTVPSFESLAINMVAQAQAQPIVDRFLELADLPWGGSNGRASSDTWTSYRRSGPRVQLLPLEYAIKKTAPAQLFDRLVYMSREGKHMDLLGNYPREELVWLFSHTLRNIERQGGRRRDSRFSEALGICAQVKNPLLEESFRQFVEDHAGKGHGSARSHVRRFVGSRLNDPAIDQGQLATWIFHFAPLEDRDKLELLTRIQDPKAYHYLQNRMVGNQPRRKDVLQYLSSQPNPSLDKFLVDTYNWYESPRGSGYETIAMAHALVRTDTPVVRELIREKWNADAKARTRLIRRLVVADWRQPNMDWLVPMIGELTDTLDRLTAVKLLSQIDTPDAYALAEKLAVDPDVNIIKAAAEQLKIRDERAARKQKQLARAAELLAGRIKPDDLLPASTAYTWNGTEYVRVNVPN